MVTLRVLVIALVSMFFMAPGFAAPGWVEYSPKRIQDAQAAGETIVVDVTADWCSTCKAQHPILEELSAEEDLHDVLFIRVDFDVHKEFLRKHNIPRQSTILVFKGDNEIGRSVAETNRARLRSFVFDSVNS